MVKYHWVVTLVYRYNIGYFQLCGKHTFWERHITNIHKRISNNRQRHFQIFCIDFIKTCGIILQWWHNCFDFIKCDWLNENSFLDCIIKIGHGLFINTWDWFCLVWVDIYEEIIEMFRYWLFVCSSWAIPQLEFCLVYRIFFLFMIFFLTPQYFFMLSLFLINNSW